MVVRAGDGMIDWSAKGRIRIVQNVRNLINTYRYELAYHRTLGLPTGIIDRPSEETLSELGVEVRALLARYEPRARVQNVVCTANHNGEIGIEVILI